MFTLLEVLNVISIFPGKKWSCRPAAAMRMGSRRLTNARDAGRAMRCAGGGWLLSFCGKDFSCSFFSRLTT
jgi:hypothetical protein